MIGLAGNAPVPVGGFPRDHLACPGAPELPAPISLGDFGPLVFGNDSLHLREQPRLRIIIEGGGVREEHRDAVASQLIDHDHLVGIDTGQAIGRQAPDDIEQPSLRGIAQRVEAGPVEPSPGVAVVAELLDELVPLGRHALSQDLELRADRPARFLGFGGYASIDRSPHRRASSPSMRSARALRISSYPAARASRRGSA